ncbi:MAG: secondary thiamine-phosphate synthase enzyme YjbQ [bacterium]
MTVKTCELSFPSKGNTDIIEITDEVEETIRQSGIKDGCAVVFVTGSTAGITTVEYESGLVQDLKEMFERIIPSDEAYHHDAKWGDGNGHSHVRASLLKSGETFPFKDQKLLLGTWQQIILIDFDNRPRTRRIIVQIMGE